MTRKPRYYMETSEEFQERVDAALQAFNDIYKAVPSASAREVMAHVLVHLDRFDVAEETNHNSAGVRTAIHNLKPRNEYYGVAQYAETWEQYDYDRRMRKILK